MLLHGWGDGNDPSLAHPISVRFPGAFFVPNGPPIR